MEQEELWEQFVASGRVADYLRFTNGYRAETSEDLMPDPDDFAAQKLWEDMFPIPEPEDEEMSDGI